MSGQFHVAVETAVTPLNIATLVIALLAWATALAALLWNVLQWKLTPGRARVDVEWGHRNIEGGDRDFPPQMSNERVVRGPWYDMEWGEGYIAVIGIEVMNRGRMKLVVREILIEFAENNFLAFGVPTNGPTLPCSIDAQDFKKWTVDIKELQKVIARGLARRPLAVQPDFVRPVVQLADRRTISPRYSIEVGWDAPEKNPPSAST